MNYQYIRNPLTNRNVRVDGPLGRRIIKKYIKEQTGGVTRKTSKTISKTVKGGGQVESYNQPPPHYPMHIPKEMPAQQRKGASLTPQHPTEIVPLYFKALKYTKSIFGKEKPDSQLRTFLIHNKHDDVPTDPNSLYYRSPQELLELAWTANAHCNDKRFNDSTRNEGEKFLQQYYNTNKTTINRCEIHKMSFTHIIPVEKNDKKNEKNDEYEVIFIDTTVVPKQSKKLLITKNVVERLVHYLTDLKVFEPFEGEDKYF